MKPVRLLLVDPNTPRRRELAAALAPDYAVFAVGAIAEAAAQEPPDIVILSLRQAGEHGLELGRAMKAGRAGVRVLVFGATETTRSISRDKIQAKWGIDAYLPYIPDGTDLRAAALALVRPARIPSVAARAVLAPTSNERADDEPTWSELLRKELSVDVLRQVATKPLFGRN